MPQFAHQRQARGLTGRQRGLVGLTQSALDYAQQVVRINTPVRRKTDTGFLHKAADMNTMVDAVWRVSLNQWVKNNVVGLGSLATDEEVAALRLRSPPTRIRS